MNTIQWVCPFLPVGCPKIGRTGVSASTSLTFTCVSAHLKIKVPFGAKTRKHSVNPWCKS